MMAALLRHGLFKTSKFSTTNNIIFARYVSKKKPNPNIDRKMPPKIDSTIESIAAKGFLRPQKSYQPPVDVENRLNLIFEKIIGNSNIQTNINTNFNQRFNLLLNCAKEFDHSIPNSLLHTIQTLGDVKQFYQTAVCTKTPLDRLKNMELPENLHIQYDYHRFHPETDTKFGGQTAFNKSSTIVTGLKYKDKYPGHKQEGAWPLNA